MSDFGTMIIATKGKDTFQQSEVNAVSQKLKEIIKNNDAYINYLGDPYEHDFHLVDGSTEIGVLLSEYYFGDEEDENDDLFSTIEEEELDDAKELAEKLSVAFPNYTFSASVEEW